MARVESRWRTESRRVIAGVLAGLPPGATDAERRKAVSAAYPFGERRMLPYKMWCEEVRRALGHRPAAAPTVEVRPSGVRCTWREGCRGCLVCGPVRERWAAHDFAAWHERLAGTSDADPTWLVYADWLEERNFLAEAQAIRDGDRVL